MAWKPKNRMFAEATGSGDPFNFAATINPNLVASQPRFLPMERTTTQDVAAFTGINDFFGDTLSATKDMFQGIDRDYAHAVSKIWIEINYNRQSWIENIIGIYKIDRKQIKAILDSYINLLKSDPNYPHFNDEATESEQYYQEKLIQMVAELSGQKTDLTHAVLRQLYWSTKQGRLKSDKFLYPKKAEKTKEFRETPKDLKGKNIFDNLGLPSWTKWAIPTTLIAGGLFFASKIISDVSEIVE